MSLDVLVRLTSWKAGGSAVGLTFDPQAAESERWLAVVGLDASAAAAEPGEALRAALAEYEAEIEEMVG